MQKALSDEGLLRIPELRVLETEHSRLNGLRYPDYAIAYSLSITNVYHGLVVVSMTVVVTTTSSLHVSIPNA